MNTDSAKEDNSKIEGHSVQKKKKVWWKRVFGMKSNTIKSKPCYEFDAYMKERVQYKIKIYDKKAHSYKRKYYFIAVMTAICATLVPVLINLKIPENWAIDKYTVATILSLFVSVGVALQEIYRFREHWRNFDLIYGNLRREQMLFSGSAGPYAEKEVKIKQELFIENIEELIKNERWETINMQTSPGPNLEVLKQEREKKIEEFLALNGYKPQQET
jgi:hypothetical protein